MISYKELTGLIDAGKDEEIMKALQDLPEQTVIALMDMQDAPHKQYLINVLNPFVPSADSLLAARKGDTSNWDDEIIDYAFRTYANGDMPKEADFDYDQAKYEQAFDKFMSDSSPFQNYVAGLRKKYGEAIAGNSDNGDYDYTDYVDLNGDGNLTEFNFTGLSDEQKKMLEESKSMPEYNDYDSDDEEPTLWDDIDSGDFPAKEFAFDGNHKFYILANDTEAREAIENGYEIYPIEQLQELYESADPLKFISSWDLDTDYMPQDPFEESSTDANGDGDTDIITADTNGNGKPDTAVVAGDDAKEEKEAVKAVKEDLGLDGDDDTSTGKKKKELEEDNTDVLSDKKQKDTCSDSRQKNIISALSELRF